MPNLPLSTEPTLRERARYILDNWMSKGTPALIALLALATFGFIVVWVLVVTVFTLLPEDLRSLGPAQRIWYGLMRAMDAGALGGDAGSWSFLIANLGITVAGLFILSALIGVLNAGLEQKLTELRRGRSRVIERDHVVVLGWNASVFTVVSELVTANENRRDACITILSPLEKAEMEDAIRDRVPDTKSTRVVCRSGSTTELADLAMVNVNASRAILALSPEIDDPDVHVIKTMLAVLHAPDRRTTPSHLVAELRSEKNSGIAKMVGRDEAEIVLAGDLISRITVQTCRQSGLSIVHTELLDFGGDEIYFGETDRLVGRKFGDILNLFPHSSVIGLRTHDGPVVLPELDRRIEPGDRVIAIAADDDAVLAALEPHPVDESAICMPERVPAVPETTLVLGWNSRFRSIVSGLDAYVAPGSELVVVAHVDIDGELETIRGEVKNVTVVSRKSDMTDRETLDTLDVGRFDHVIVLGDEEVDAERSDSRVLVTLLHLREIGQRIGKDLAIVSEMRDVRNRRLAEVTDADDFIVSDKLVSLMMCQVAENKELHAVLADLFDPDGAEIYLKPATDYVVPETTVEFATLVESAKRRGEIAIGYRVEARARDASAAYGVRVNPPKAERVALGASDKLIVVAAN